MSLRSNEFYRRRVGKAATTMRAMVRRMVVKVTTRALWQAVGYVDEEESDIEVFSNVGFYSRPPDSGGSPEVIVLKVGGKTAHPVIIASRDERTRQTLVAIRDMLADESAIYNSSARVHVKQDGTVEVDDGSGAVELALKSDVDALETWNSTHAHAGVTTGAGTSGPPSTSPPSATGTTVLKGK